MNYITPAKQSLLPVITHQPAARPPVATTAVAGENSDATHKQPSTYVYRGEVLDTVSKDRRYQPRSNLQIAAQNQRAIDTYLSVSEQLPAPDEILDRYV